jgi:two-component system nitrate/nitrite response regulator NarL
MDKRAHPIRIVIASDDPIFRDELRRLESEQDMKVVGEACDGFEAVKLATEIKPDILLLDLDMPHHTGLDALRDLNRANRAGGAGPVRIILLTAAVEKKQVVEALQLGARGVVLKCTTGQLLLKSIHAVMAGEYWVGRDRISNLVQCLRDLMQSVNEEQKNFGLTPRELQIISGVVAGYSDREIAQYIKFTEDTIKFHLSHIFDKPGVSPRSELAQFAVNHRLPLKAIL